jgi:hypothetical protein
MAGGHHRLQSDDEDFDPQLHSGGGASGKVGHGPPPLPPSALAAGEEPPANLAVADMIRVPTPARFLANPRASSGAARVRRPPSSNRKW